MNRYPLWKYVLVVLVLALGALYTIPNFFGESPAVQVSSAKATLKLGPDAVIRVQQALETASVRAENVFFEDLGNNGTVRVRFANTDLQFKAKTVIEQALNKDPTDPSYLVAFNLLPNTPAWLQSLHALPMYLGLDLRGGVHFLMQVDTRAVMAKRVQAVQMGARSLLVEKKLRFAGISRDGDAIDIRFRDQETLAAAKNVLGNQMPELALVESTDAEGAKLTGYVADARGVLSTGSAAPINIRTADLPPQLTKTVDSVLNLDSRQAVPTTTPFSMSDPTTYNNATSVSVYDSLGNAHVLQTFYVKTGAGTWDVYAAADQSLINGGAAIGSLAFGTDGEIGRASCRERVSSPV